MSYSSEREAMESMAMPDTLAAEAGFEYFEGGVQSSPTGRRPSSLQSQCAK